MPGSWLFGELPNPDNDRRLAERYTNLPAALAWEVQAGAGTKGKSAVRSTGGRQVWGAPNNAPVQVHAQAQAKAKAKTQPHTPVFSQASHRGCCGGDGPSTLASERKGQVSG